MRIILNRCAARVKSGTSVTCVLVVTRYLVPAEESTSFAVRAERALEVLVARPGCTGGCLGRSVDDPTVWSLTTTWEGVGAYRRALSWFEVKVVAVPLLSRAVDEPSAFECLVRWEPTAGVVRSATDRTPDSDVVGPGGSPQEPLPDRERSAGACG
jgi:hypothetical protein